MNHYAENSGYYDEDSYAGENDIVFLQEEYDDGENYLDGEYFGEDDEQSYLDDEAFDDHELSAAEFDLGKTFKKITSVGKKVLKNPLVSSVVSKGLPMAGGALGTIIGGPVGTAVGSQVGQFAGGALLGGKGGKKKKKGSTPAAKLLQMAKSPTVTNALGSLATGAVGEKATLPGGFDLAALFNMLATFAQQASADAEEFSADEFSNEGLSEDFISPEDHAQAIYESVMLHDFESAS